MDYLKTLFEEQLQVYLDEQGDARIGGEAVFSPAAILRTDDVAYESEFNYWLSEQWLPEEDAALGRILECDANAKRYGELTVAIGDELVIPLLGSGMSVPAGLPTWSDFLTLIRKSSTLPEAELEDLLARGAFEEAAEKLLEAMPLPLFEEKIDHHLQVPDMRSVRGPICLLPTLFNTLALTTNLDRVAEGIWDSQGKAFQDVFSGRKIREYRRRRGGMRSMLLKLHGDAEVPEDRVLTRVEYEEAYGENGAIREEIALIYRTRTLLCLGCSLTSDRMVQLIHDVAQTDRGIPKHYAFLKVPERGDSRLEREHFLSERGIFPIWYEGDHDEDLQALLVGLLTRVGKL